MGHRKAYHTDYAGSTTSNARSHTGDTVRGISCYKLNVRIAPHRVRDIDGMAFLHDSLLYSNDCKLCMIFRRFVSKYDGRF